MYAGIFVISDVKREGGWMRRGSKVALFSLAGWDLEGLRTLRQGHGPEAESTGVSILPDDPKGEEF